jgi:uracil-DNA glycosylase
VNTVGRDALVDLVLVYEGCVRCPLLVESRSQVVFGSGNARASIMVIGEAPGGEEDWEGEPFIGMAGRLLMNLFAHALKDEPDIQRLTKYTDDDEYFQELRDYLDRFIFWCNIVCCRPEDNRDPVKDEIKACNDRLNRTIYAVDPLLIIGAGKIAATTLLGKSVAVTNESGTIYDISIPSPVTGRPVRYPMMALVHPAWLARQGDQDLVKRKQGKTYEAIEDLGYGLDLVRLYAGHHGDTFPPE